jgi:hypothetical protein
MDDWIRRYAQSLGMKQPAEVDDTAILAFARDVAHATERKNAPLASFLAGYYVARREAGGASVSDALTDALAVAERLLRDD